jgi:hypothetical protein
MEMGAFTGALVALLAKDMASAIASEMGKDVSGAAKQALRRSPGCWARSTGGSTMTVGTRPSSWRRPTGGSPSPRSARSCARPDGPRRAPDDDGCSSLRDDP